MAGEFSAPEPSNYQAYIDSLVEKVKTVGLSGMESADVDALDEAIELGFVSEDELRGVEDAA